LTRKTFCVSIPAVPPTIRDVARHAGVSIATVSHALSGNRPVSAELRRRVVHATERLGYRPSHLAQAMVTGRSKTLGLIVPDIANPFFPEVARGAEDAAADRGYGVLLADSELDPDEEQRCVDAFQDKGVDGLIYLAGTPVLGPALADAAAAGTPLVLVDEELPVHGPRCGFVGVENREGGRLAARHLLDAGLRRIAVIAGPGELPTAQARLAGFLDALTGAGVDPCAHVTADAYRFEDGQAAAERVLAGGPPPQALLCANDLLALGAMNVVRDAGLAVPADVAVAGFDDIFFARFFSPALTTVAQPMRRIGAEAAELLIDLIEGRHSDRRRLLPVHLVARASTHPKGGSHGAI
jgi:LacI family transcriptional regulator, galactose operon repressor